MTDDDALTAFEAAVALKSFKETREVCGNDWLWSALGKTCAIARRAMERAEKAEARQKDAFAGWQESIDNQKRLLKERDAAIASAKDWRERCEAAAEAACQRYKQWRQARAEADALRAALREHHIYVNSAGFTDNKEIACLKPKCLALAPRRPEAEVPAIVPTPAGWVCVPCGHRNLPQLQRCLGCDAERPHDSKPPSPSLEPAKAEPCRCCPLCWADYNAGRPRRAHEVIHLYGCPSKGA